ncbi:hypothetical protein AB0M23_18430 [Streptomyces sp. NPDC052077]|uniref:hypothetical protein n=1 Tax=Streptomyces sp. NPDC052077 TaxID=3154757 RepID=UPI00344873C8
MLPPSAIAGVSVVCAVGPWVVAETTVLRALAAAAAVTAVVGAVVMRRWDAQAGKRVADLSRARASDEWRHEERAAELESDLDESRELRAKLEQKLRAKRAELAKLRNEHAALLRRYATAETERASALEGRRLLEIEAVPPTRALPAPRTAPVTATPGEPVRPTGLAPAAGPGRSAGAVRAGGPEVSAGVAERVGAEELDEAGEAVREILAAFPAGGAARLYALANEALNRLGVPDDDEGGDEGADGADDDDDSQVAAGAVEDDAEGAENAGSPEGAEAAESAGEGDRADGTDGAEPDPDPDGGGDGDGDGGDDGDGGGEAVTAAEPAPQGVVRPRDGSADDGPAAAPSARSAASAHFAVEAAVAVAPAEPARRPRVEGGFDFFGTKGAGGTGEAAGGPRTGAPVAARGAEAARGAREALESVQDEDLADVIGEEALALHKAETRARREPVARETRGTDRVIDLTAHDETEQIDVKGLRSAVS